MASVQSDIDRITTTKGDGLNVATNLEKSDDGESEHTDTLGQKPLRFEDHLDFSEPSPTSSIVNVLEYVQLSSGNGRYKSLVHEMVEKSTNAIYLTQKTSLKIALLIDAITKKQSSFLRRLTGKAKPDPDVVAFQEYLGSLQRQEDLWSTVCSSTLSESVRVKKDLAEHPEVFKAMSQSPKLYHLKGTLLNFRSRSKD